MFSTVAMPLYSVSKLIEKQMLEFANSNIGENISFKAGVEAVWPSAEEWEQIWENMVRPAAEITLNTELELLFCALKIKINIQFIPMHSIPLTTTDVTPWPNVQTIPRYDIVLRV